MLFVASGLKGLGTEALLCVVSVEGRIDEGDEVAPFVTLAFAACEGGVSAITDGKRSTAEEDVTAVAVAAVMAAAWAGDDPDIMGRKLATAGEDGPAATPVSAASETNKWGQ